MLQGGQCVSFLCECQTDRLRYWRDLISSNQSSSLWGLSPQALWRSATNIQGPLHMESILKGEPNPRATRQCWRQGGAGRGEWWVCQAAIVEGRVCEWFLEGKCFRCIVVLCMFVYVCGLRVKDAGKYTNISSVVNAFTHHLTHKNTRSNGLMLLTMRSRLFSAINEAGSCSCLFPWHVLRTTTN